MPIEKNVCNIQCNIGYQAFLTGMMGKYNYKMPMEFLKKDTVLTLCYQSMITQQTTKMAEIHVSNDLTSPHKK